MTPAIFMKNELCASMWDDFETQFPHIKRTDVAQLTRADNSLYYTFIRPEDKDAWEQNKQVVFYTLHLVNANEYMWIMSQLHTPYDYTILHNIRQWRK